MLSLALRPIHRNLSKVDLFAGYGLIVVVVIVVLAVSDARRKRKRREDETRRLEAARRAHEAQWHAGQQALEARRARLAGRFGEPAASLILDRRLWQGATEAMVLEMHGHPADIRERVLKTKVARTLCYYRQGRNSFALKVKLENGVVVGWDIK